MCGCVGVCAELSINPSSIHIHIMILTCTQVGTHMYVSRVFLLAEQNDSLAFAPCREPQARAGGVLLQRCWPQQEASLNVRGRTWVGHTVLVCYTVKDLCSCCSPSGLSSPPPPLPTLTALTGRGGGGGPTDVLDMPVDPNEPTYCLCHQVSFGEMIGCDNTDVSTSHTHAHTHAHTHTHTHTHTHSDTHTHTVTHTSASVEMLFLIIIYTCT